MGSRLGWFTDFYPDLLYLDTRGSDGRTPTDYDMNLSVGYNLSVGPVTITPMLYVFNLQNRQTVTSVVQAFNVNGTFVTDQSSQFYEQAGVQPGTGSCPTTATAPCSDNCDRTTMTQDDIRNGRLICEIGIASVRPAEFVIFRVFQQTAEAQR